MDGAIHRAGGPAILEACRLLGGCGVGDAKATTAGRLPARYVIHTVGPVWNGGEKQEDAKLASAHRRSVEVAGDLGIASIAFPAISTGIFGFPIERAGADRDPGRPDGGRSNRHGARRALRALLARRPRRLPAGR